MFFIPGWLVSLLTFPGVIVHEAAHKFFCDLAGVPVFKVCYFRLGNPSGYVIHGVTGQLRANFLISIGPLIVNTVPCALLCFSPAVVFELDTVEYPLVILLLAWLGLSIGMYAFPSNQDMANFSQAVRQTGRRDFVYYGALISSLLVRIANILRVAWFDVVYAIGVGWGVPFLLLRL